MAGNFPLWAQILTGIALVAILFFWGPSAVRALKHSPRGTAGDWIGLAKPMAIVVGIIVILILLVRA